MECQNLGAEGAGAARIRIGGVAVQATRRSREAEALPNGVVRGQLDTVTVGQADLNVATWVNCAKAVVEDVARIIAVARHPPIAIGVVGIKVGAPTGR